MYWSLDVCLVLGGLSLHGSFAQLHSEHPQTSPVILWCLYILYITVYIYMRQYGYAVQEQSLK